MGEHTHKKKKAIRVAAVQYRIGSSDPAAHRSFLGESIGTADADLIVFPEACSSGFDFVNLSRIADENRRLLPDLATICRTSQKACLLPLLWQEADTYWNRSFFIADSGEVLAWYDKIHLIAALNEDRHLTAGQKIVTIEWANWQIGLATCFDLRFPPMFRRQPRADLFLLPALWPAVRQEHMLVLSQGRSIENQTPFILANATGQSGSIVAAGHSRIFDARGQTLAGLSDEEAMILATIDPEDTERWRESFLVNTNLW